MKVRTRAIAGISIAILTIAASRVDGQETKTSRKRAESYFVTTVGTHVICAGTVTVRVYEEADKLNYRVTRNWSDHEGESVRIHTSGPVEPPIDEDADWFIYAESPDEVWTFDGRESLILREMGPPAPDRESHGGIYEIHPDSDFQSNAIQRIANKAPQALRDRLPEAFRAKFPRGVPGTGGRVSKTGSVGQAPRKPNPASKAALDWSVLEATLKDLITWTDGPFEDRKNANPTIFFSTARPYKWVSAGKLIDDFQLGLDRDKISGSQFQLVREAVKNLVRRQDDRDNLARFRPTDKRIVVWDPRRAQEERAARARRDRPQIFCATTPGFSQDGQVAIVRVSFNWSIHRGEGTYVLLRRDGEWVVLVRDFGYSL
jgi:hypothetical protein